jgi:uncharacterized repeat protein (TIGR01451 family)
MKSSLPLLSLVLVGAAFGPPLQAQAQATLEFSSGAGNPTTNGTTVGNQVITFQNNANNPNDNTFTAYTPTTTATFSLSNPQYTLPTSKMPTGTAVVFGGNSNGGGQLAGALALFPRLNAIGTPTNAMFSASANNVGTGIDVALNNATEIYMSAEPLPSTVPANARYQYVDLTITFSQPITNPVLDFSGLGSSPSTNANYTGGIGFTTELDLLTPGVTLSRLSGSNELTVNATQILNNAGAPGPTSNNGGASGSVLVTTPTAGVTTLTFRLFLRPNALGGSIHSPNDVTHSGDGWLIGVSSLATAPPITGYVYEDVNYGGGAGRPRSAAGTVVRPNARVELYNSAGTFVSATTTDANGLYSFTPGAGNYTVRVVNSTVTSSRTGAVAGLLPVQTYNGGTGRVGGEAPEKADAGNGAAGGTLAGLTSATATAESIASVSTAVGAATAVGADFGFNFDLVVNTNNAGQGSLRQFITNANALGGEGTLAQSGSNVAGFLPAGVETSIFMIPSGAAVAGQDAGLASGLTTATNTNPTTGASVTSQVANITLTAALPAITGPATSIDGTTQTFNIGNTNNQPLGTGGTVGTGGTALSQLNGPEVQVRGTNAFNGFALNANNTTVRGLSIYGFNNGIFGGVNNTGTRIEQNVIGASAISFTDPGTGARTLNEAINLNDSDNGFVTNNLIGFNGGMGVWVQTNGNGANNNAITGNEIRSNALVRNVGNGERLVFDGMELQGNSTGNTVSGNLITANVGHGIDSYGNGIGGNTITGNTISNNGVGVANNTGEEGSGLRIFGATNPTLIANNVLTGNNGSGVLLMGTASQVTISQNVTSGNTRLGIDLLTTGETNLNSTAAGTPFWNGNTGTTSNVTLNDNGDTATGGNGLLNFPVLTTATVSGSSLVINGFARPGSLVELFLATPLTTDPTASNRSFGQGSSFLTSRTEGNATDDSNNGTGTYGANNAAVNGVYQGTDNTNQFTFTIALADLPVAQRNALLSGAATLTSTATLARSTSEFSGNIALPIVDVTAALTGPQTVSPGQPTGTYTATFTNEGPVTASAVGRTVTLPAGATNVVLPAGATQTGNVIDFGTAATLASGASTSFTFSFTPASSATGPLAITSNVTTSTSQGNNAAPDASTINATVVPVADVATTLVATTGTVVAGTLGTATTPPTFTVTFSNLNGPSLASGVVAAVQLPTGLTNVKSTNNTNGIYNPATGVLTYPGITSIANGGSTTSAITFDAPSTGSVVASSTISTTTNEAGLTANNRAAATMTATPAFDLTTTITGPTAAVIGDLVTLAVTTTNNGPSAVANAVQTVQLASGLTNVYVSNGGVYNPATTTQSFTVNGVSYSVPAGGVVFPTIASLPSGQTLANSISFAQPSTALAPVATVTPNTASTTTTTGDTNPANNQAYLNANPNSTSVAVLNPQVGTANAYTTITTSTASSTVGSPVTLTVTTGNRGPNQATGVTQTVQLVPGFTTGTLLVNGVTGTLASNVITFGTGGPTYNTLTGIVTFPTLADGTNGSTSATSVTNTITLTPSAATATSVATTGTNGQLLAMAAVRTTNTDPVAADNVSSVALTLVQSADMATSITGPASAVPGQSVTYTATFLNNGPMAATNVAQSAQLPAGLGTNGVTITDAAGNSVSGATYSSATGLVTFPALPTNASGATQIFQLTFVAPAQNFAPSSSVTTTSADAVGANNTASVATTVAASADLATTVAGPATAVVGNAVTYTVNTTNNGSAVANSAVTTLQLASGFSTSTLLVNGVAGTTGAANTINYNLGAAGTATYNTSSGLVTFPTLAYLPVGTTSSNYVSFVMPNPTGGQTTGVASASATGTDPVPANNSASVATSIAPTTTTQADLTATVTVPAGSTTVTPGSSLTYTATYGNIGAGAAASVMPTLQLVPGLTTSTLIAIAGTAGTVVPNSNLISYSNGTITYNTQTGVVTFPTIASQATGTSGNVSYAVQIVVPNNGPLLATAVTASNTSEPNNALANNANSVSVGITPSFNEVTSISGPATAVAGTSLTYTVTATNNGPSATNNPTTQSVTVPAGQTPTNITNGGIYANNAITWTIAAGQAPGANGAVANSFTIVQPTGGANLTATVQVNGESNSGDNTATISTTVANRAPLAYAVVNALQNPQSNEAGGLTNGLLISPLNALDPENSFDTNKYTVVTVPTNSTGVSPSMGTLYYSTDGTATGTYVAVTAGRTLTDAQAQTLRFKASSAFVGNASFTYFTTDAAGNVSPTVSYTIPVESDVDARSYALTPVKGGSSGAYTTGDVIAFTTDANGAVYNATSLSVYQANGTLQSGASNGIASASAVAGSFISSRPGVTSLADIGLSVDATGRIVVSNPGTVASPILRSGDYSVQITTVDGNGGLTTNTVAFKIPGAPLPVVLTAFTATAVGNRDAQLSWTTASEENSAFFDLERSLDGVSFTKVGQVAAQGTTIAATTYAFTDKGVASLTAATVYYRLKQVDRDATATYSPVRTVSFSKAASLALSLYPNPAQYATGLDLSQLPTSASYQVQLLDATGRLVRTATLAGGQVQPLNLTELATGTYHVLVTGTRADGSALRQTLRLTKE